MDTFSTNATLDDCLRYGHLIVAYRKECHHYKDLAHKLRCSQCGAKKVQLLSSHMRDRIRGQYAIPSSPDGILLRAGRVARNLNYLRLLGGMTLLAFPDIAGIEYEGGEAGECRGQGRRHSTQHLI